MRAAAFCARSRPRFALLGATFLIVASSGAQVSFHPALNYPVGEKPEGGLLFDYDGDGDLDLLVTSERPDKIEFLMNDGAGSFVGGGSVTTGSGTSPEGLAVGDFDGDGDLDLVAALFSANAVQLVWNGGAGVFTLGGTFAVGVEPSIVVAADFDGDGLADAAVNNRVSGDMSVLLNDGAGGFAPAVHYAVGDETRCIAVGDITGDGWPDLAVSARDSRLVRMFRNDGDGAFQILRDLSLGTTLEPHGVALADLDGDGALDVVTASSGGNELQEHPSVFLQNNGGRIGIWVGPINGTVLPGVSPRGIVAADFDLDGHIDVATANADTNDVSICRNGGIGIFFLPVIYAVGENPEALVAAAGDLDGSGSADIVTFNRDSNSVSVLLNQAFAPAPGDTDGDGDVDLSDLGVVLAAFGLCSGDVGYSAAADFDGSGCIDLSDLGVVLSNFGS